MQVSPLHGKTGDVPATNRNTTRHTPPADQMFVTPPLQRSSSTRRWPGPRPRQWCPSRETFSKAATAPAQPRCRRCSSQFGEDVSRAHVFVKLARCRSEPNFRQHSRERRTGLRLNETDGRRSYNGHHSAGPVISVEKTPCPAQAYLLDTIEAEEVEDAGWLGTRSLLGTDASADRSVAIHMSSSQILELAGPRGPRPLHLRLAA